MMNVIERSDQRRQDMNARISATQDHHNYAVAAGMMLHLHCPKCDMAREIVLKPFRKGSWQPAHCSNCRKAWGIKLWNCACHTPWRQCQRHSAVAGALPTTPHTRLTSHDTPSGSANPPPPKRYRAAAAAELEFRRGAPQSGQTKRARASRSAAAPPSGLKKRRRRKTRAEEEADARYSIERGRSAPL